MILDYTINNYNSQLDMDVYMSNNSQYMKLPNFSQALKIVSGFVS